MIFVGIFSFVGGFRSLRWVIGGGSSCRSSSRDSGGGALIAILALTIIAIATRLAIMIRSRLAEGNTWRRARSNSPRIGRDDLSAEDFGNAALNAPSEVREMFIENPHSDFMSVFATHPPIEKRIAALVKFAGGRAAAPAAPAAAPAKAGPWG